MCARSPAPTPRASSSRLRAPPRCGSGCRSRRGSNTPIFRRALACARRPCPRQGRATRGAARSNAPPTARARSSATSTAASARWSAVKPAAARGQAARSGGRAQRHRCRAGARARARQGVPVDVIESAEGKFPRDHCGPGRAMAVDLNIVKSDRDQAQLPWKLSPRAAQVSISKERVTVSGLEGFAEKSTFSAVAADIDLEGKRLASASAARGSSSRSGSPGCERRCRSRNRRFRAGRCRAQPARARFDRPAEAEFDAIVTPRKVSAAVKALPVRQRDGRLGPAARSRVLLRDLAGSLGNSRSAISTQIELGRRRSCRRRRGVRASSSRSGFPGCGTSCRSRRSHRSRGRPTSRSPASRYASIGRRRPTTASS